MKWFLRPSLSLVDCVLLALIAYPLAKSIGLWALACTLPIALLSSHVERRFWRVVKAPD